jgi:hypothetical protein
VPTFVGESEPTTSFNAPYKMDGWMDGVNKKYFFIVFLPEI